MISDGIQGGVYPRNLPHRWTPSPPPTRLTPGSVTVAMARETDPKKRIVITGMGVVSCFGNDVDTFYDKVRGRGRSPHASPMGQRASWIRHRHFLLRSHIGVAEGGSHHRLLRLT